MNESVRHQAKAHWDQIAKPIASLGLMEEDIVTIAGIQGSADPKKLDISRRALLIFCGDHGVTEEGVTQTGRGVTRQVAENFANGRSTVNILADQVNCDVYTVDIGIDCEPYRGQELKKSLPFGFFGADGDPSERILNRKLGRGTGNLAREAAMSVTDCRRALAIGQELVKELKERGYQLIATGEMGIGNTTSAAALTSAYLKLPPEATVGRGAGLSDAGIVRKREAVARALARVTEEKRTDPTELLAELGGYEIAGMAGAFLGGAAYGIPILLDGAISAAACLAASLIDPRVPEFAIASHSSGEQMERRILEHLGLQAMIDGGLCLGEGSGCMALLPLLDLAMAVYKGMGTFDEYAIASYHRFGNEPDREACHD